MGYWNEIDKKETRQIIQQDCYRTRAESQADLEASGRFKRVNETRVVGAGAKYPEIKSGPWSEGDPGAPDAITDRYGVAIDQQEPVGSVQEIERSLQQSDAPAASFSSGDAAAAGTDRPYHFPSVRPQPFRRRF
jgi:hypothetical protein